MRRPAMRGVGPRRARAPVGTSASRGAAFALALLLGATGCAAVPASSPTGAATTAIEPWGEDVFALSERADRAYREARWIDAARHYGALTERVPADAYAWFRLGNTFAQQGAFDRAVLAYERSIERDADQPKPWFNLSTAYLLNAQRAMTRAWSAMRPGDPARAMIERRLAVLADLMHDRIEDGPTHTGARR